MEIELWKGILGHRSNIDSEIVNRKFMTMGVIVNISFVNGYDQYIK